MPKAFTINSWLSSILIPQKSKPPKIPDRNGRKLKNPGKNAAAVAQGKLGGRKGGLAGAANLSPEKRKKIAKKAARARWAKKK